MKIALINARDSMSSVVPTGLLSIGTLLNNEEHNVKIFDYLSSDPILYQRLILFSPDLIGISFMTTEYSRAKDIIDWIKINFPKTILCAGGYHVTALPERSLRDLPIDFVVLGEGELTMKEICNNISSNNDLINISGTAYLNENGKYIENPRREFINNLDELPIINRELLDNGFDWYLTLPGNIRGHMVEKGTTIMTSRGCPGKCIFCASGNMWSGKIRQRSVENVIKEIELIVKHYGIKGLFFLDDTFTVYKKWVLEFCRQLNERKIKITWGCSARVNTVNDEILTAMKSSGCVQLDFGVESGSDNVLRVMHKGQNVNMIKNAFKTVHVHNLKTLACFIIGNPDETYEDIQMTLQIAKEIKPYYTIFSILTPLPGSPLYQIALNNGWISDNIPFDHKWSIRQSDMPVMAINFSREELLKIRQKLEDSFWFSNFLSYLIPLIKKPSFVIDLIWVVISQPAKYLKYITGSEKRRFTGFVESIYYDYKKMKAKQYSSKNKKNIDSISTK